MTCCPRRNFEYFRHRW